jgi:hypothetical protein
VDQPPRDEWFRIGVHYSEGFGFVGNVYPTVSVSCDGEVRAVLGEDGFDAPIIFSAAQEGTAVWLVADVRFVDDGCGGTACDVKPVFLNDAGAPYVATKTVLESSFGPAYPPE